MVRDANGPRVPAANRSPLWVRAGHSMLGAKSGGYPAVAPLRKARNKIVVVNDRMQKGYRYELVAPVGRDFGFDFGLSTHPRRCFRSEFFAGST